MKKTLILAVLLTFFTSIFAFDFEYEYENNTLAYTILTDSTVSVAASANKPTGALIIPDSVEYNELKYAVTEVAEYGFDKELDITSINLPVTIRTIHRRAFSNLTQNNLNITLNEGLEVIGSGAFRNSIGMVGAIMIPYSVSNIGTLAFGNCTGISMFLFQEDAILDEGLDLTAFDGTGAIVLKDNIYYLVISDSEAIALKPYDKDLIVGELKIADTIIKDAKSLKITSILGNRSFEKLSSMTTLILPKYLRKIGKNAFRDNVLLENITFNENLEIIGNRSFIGCTNISRLDIPNSIIEVQERAFQDCKALTTIYMHPMVAPTAGGAVFYAIEPSPTLKIPCSTSDTYISKWGSQNVIISEECNVDTIIDGVSYTLNLMTRTAAINGCQKDELPGVLILKDYIHYKGNDIKVTKISNNVFESATKLTSVTISSTIESIEKYAFYKCYNLQKIVCGENLISIGDTAFQNCTKLESIEFRDGLKYIGKRAFYGCAKLKSLKFNEGLLSIGNRAFCNCSGLISLVLPSTLQEIQLYAFHNATSLESVTMRAKIPIGVHVFDFKIELPEATYPIYVLCGDKDYYTTATGWADLGDRVKEICEPLVIHHHTSTTGVKSFEGGNPMGIEYRRTFTPFIWETIYLPFEIDEMYLIEDGTKYDMNLVCVPSIQNGYFYLAEFDKDEFVFSSDKQLKSGKPYAIMFDDTYYEDKEFVFATSELVHIPFSGKPSASASSMSYVGNTTMMPQPIRAPFYTSQTLPEGYFDLRYESGILQPFECVLYPQKAAPVAQLPRRVGAPRKPNTATSIPGAPMIDSNALICFANGNTLSILTQGKSVTIYSVMGNLIATIPQGINEASVELNTGCYIIVAEGYSQKIIL